MPKSKKYVESSDDSSDSEPKSEKKVSKKSKRENSDVEASQSKKSKKEKKEEDNAWDLGNNRQVTVREFKGKLLIDIREMYYDKEGELKPGKKGISLNTAQWRKFVDAVADVDEAVKSMC